MSNLNMINNEHNMLSTSSSNNLSQPNSQKIQKSTEEDRMLELKVAEQSIDFSNKNFSR